MAENQDYSYLGSGLIRIREYGAAAPFVAIGNCSALTLSPQEEEKEQKDYTSPGGGTRSSVRRLTGVDCAYTFHDFSAENFARALRADISNITAGTSSAESVVAYKGGFTPLAKIATSITSVTGAGGTPTYVAGTDYEFRDGGIYIPSTSSIVDPVAGAANIKVTYPYAAQKRVQALVNSAKNYEVIFTGLNEAQSGKRMVVRLHKVSGGLLQQMSLIGEDYGAGEVQGKLQSDSTKSGVGISKYFLADLEDIY